MNTFSNLETFFTTKLYSLLGTYLSIFSNKVVFLLQLGIPLLVLYYGYSILTPRGSHASIQEMMFNLVRIAIIFAFVENSAGLLDLAIGFIRELKTGFLGGKSVFRLLDEQLLVTQQLSEDVFYLDTGFIKLQGFLASSMIWLGTILVLASSAITFIAAEAGLALLTVTSPLFIGCLTYGFTRELFNGWLRSIFSCIITLIFATLVVKMGIDVNKEAIVQLAAAPAEKSLTSIGATALVLGVIVSSLVLVAAKIAGNIAGVAATSAIQGGMALGARAGINTVGRPIGIATKSIGSKIFSRFHKNQSASGGDQGTPSQPLAEKSQKASFARVQQTNSES